MLRSADNVSSTTCTASLCQELRAGQGARARMDQTTVLSHCNGQRVCCKVCKWRRNNMLLCKRVKRSLTTLSAQQYSDAVRSALCESQSGLG